MPRPFLWLADVHLNHVTLEKAEQFLQEVRMANPQGIFITGDLAEQPETPLVLAKMAQAWNCTIYFVLGNHDFYFSSFDKTRAAVAEVCQTYPHLHYLTAGVPHAVAPGVWVAGHDGWADGRSGDFLASWIMMNDYRLIEDLAGLNKLARWEKLKQLGDEASEAALATLSKIPVDCAELYFLTHVPPFRQACWYQGEISNDEWAPHFVCAALGNALRLYADAHPQRKIVVLCGHTHSAGVAYLAPNLVVHTGGAEYGAPAIQRTLLMGGPDD